MELITERDLILNVVRLWEEVYDNGRYALDREKIDILNKLRELNLSTAKREYVDEIIGNNSWTTVTCDECGKTITQAVLLGQEPDYESNTATICFDCLNKATDLCKECGITEKAKNDNK